MSSLWKIADRLRHRARLRQWDTDHAYGRRAEDLAHRYLRERRYIVVGRNFKMRSGHAEVDLVAWDCDRLVFVEVKSRQKGVGFGPEERVNEEKRRKLRWVAMEYTRRADIPFERVRFDIITVVHQDAPVITHFRDAF